MHQESKNVSESVGDARAIDEETFIKFMGNLRLHLSDQNKSSGDNRLYISRMTAVSLEEYNKYRAVQRMCCTDEYGINHLPGRNS